MKRITMGHGAGGTLMQDLIKHIILKHLGGSNAEVPLEALDDSAVINDIVLKSDSHTVKPLFFPGSRKAEGLWKGLLHRTACFCLPPSRATRGESRQTPRC